MCIKKVTLTLSRFGNLTIFCLAMEMSMSEHEHEYDISKGRGQGPRGWIKKFPNISNFIKQKLKSQGGS